MTAVAAKSVGALHNWTMRQPTVASWFGRVVMGTYVNRVYREVDAISEIADGAGILDGAPLERRVRRVVSKPAPF
jgi:hypothetical protein